MTHIRRYGRRDRSSDVKADMLRLVVKAARKAKVPMAIGGGIAVAAHGYKRETSDVDAFFRYADKLAVLRALRQLAVGYEIEPLDESHWVAFPGSVADERIDLMFATGDPEESAIEMAEERVYRGVRAPTFSAVWLVVTKYLADRDDPKDWLDIYALHQRGAFDVRAVVRRFTQMGMSDAVVEFPAFMKRLAGLKTGKKSDS